MSRPLRFVALAVCAVALLADSPSARLKSRLDRIFTAHDFTPRIVDAQWTDNGAAYTVVESPAGGNEIAKYETATGARSARVTSSALTPAGATQPLEVEDYKWSADGQRLLVYTNTRKVWRENTRGDYWVLDLTTPKLRKLGGAGPEASLMFAKFSPNGRAVAWVRANDIYVEDVTTGAIRRLTTDGSATRINGTSDWVNEEELDIRDGFTWSPDGRSIAYWQFDTTGVSEWTLLNETDAEYPVLRRFAYPHPGGRNSAVRLGIVDVATAAARWVKTPGDPREHYVFRFDWAPDSRTIAVEYLNRPQNLNQILIADAATGAVSPFAQDSDAAWVDVLADFHWFDGRQFLWLSERDGWRHAYVAQRGGGDPRRITAFDADVIAGVTVDARAGWLYFLASPSNATQRYLYRAPLSGGAPVRVTPVDEPGSHGYDVSPDGRFALHTWSTIDDVPVTELVSLPDHKAIRTLEANAAVTARLKDVGVARTEFFHVTAADGAVLDGWMMKPRNFDASKKYPVLTFVYGEVAGTTVVDAFNGTTQMFHRAVAEEGYIVLSIDNEGTPAPKGRTWRKAMYHGVGVLSSTQQAEAIRRLVQERPYLDGTRMAIWGWSGGGSNTLNVMFRYPGVYGTGMAVAPVPDQRLYDSTYQERYSGLPAENPESYFNGSAINFAGALSGNLLLVHGSGDDNVHFQGSEKLINRLVELGKPFDFMDYPNRTHAIAEGPGTTLHIFNLLARYLVEHVPAGAR